MHKFLRAAGFSMYQKKKDIEKLLDLLETQPSVTKCVQIDEETKLERLRTLRDLADSVSQTSLARFIGKEVDVLVLDADGDRPRHRAFHCR